MVDVATDLYVTHQRPLSMTTAEKPAISLFLRVNGYADRSRMLSLIHRTLPSRCIDISHLLFGFRLGVQMLAYISPRRGKFVRRLFDVSYSAQGFRTPRHSI